MSIASDVARRTWRRRCARWLGRIAAVALATGLLLESGEARADATAWVHMGGGVIGWKEGPANEFDVAPIMPIDLGVGVDERVPFGLGGLFRIQPIIGEGTDLALMARITTPGFQTSWFGLAADLGGYHRFWGEESNGFIGQAVVGGPFGLQLAFLGTVGSDDAGGFGTTLGIDFARLTVHRRHLLDWWPNPRPSDSIGSARLR
jgi:hypothetical protein